MSLVIQCGRMDKTDSFSRKFHTCPPRIKPSNVALDALQDCSQYCLIVTTASRMVLDLSRDLIGLACE